VEIHDLASGRVDAITAPQFVYHVAWHPAAPSLAIAAQDSVVHFYDLATGEVRASMDRAETSVFSTAAFNARGSLLATTGWDQLLRVWNPISGRAEVVDQKRGSALEVQFRADDRQLASVAEGREYTVWNVAESDGCRSFARADWFDLSPDGRLVACVQGDVAKLLDAGSGRELASYKDLRVEWVQFSPDGRLLATKAQLPSGGAGLFLSPLVWRQSGAMETLRVGPPRFVLGSRRSWFGKFAFSADGGSLAMTLGANGVGPYAAVIDTAPPESIRTLVEHPGVNHLALDPSGSVLTTAAFHGRDVKAWELPSGALLKTLPLAKGLVESSPDGESLLVSSGKDFTLFRVQTWEKLWSVARDDPSDVATPGTFSASGSIVALGKSKRVATLHDAASGRKLVALRSPNPGFIADRLKFSADGAKLWVGRADGSLEVWDLRSLRSRLAALGLDWEGAPFPAPGADREKLEIQVEVDLGDLGPNSWPTIGDRQLDSALRRFRERAQAR
jgi:WD40 repeat protein